MESSGETGGNPPSVQPAAGSRKGAGVSVALACGMSIRASHRRHPACHRACLWSPAPAARALTCRGRAVKRVVVIGAGAAGTDGGDLRGRGGRRGDARGAHARRRAQDPHQRRRAVQRAAGARGRVALRDRLLAQPAAQDGALVAARRAARVLRGRRSASRSRRRSSRPSCSPPRTRRATCATACWSTRARCGVRTRMETRVTGIAPHGRRVVGVGGQRGPAAGRRGHRGHRRALRAQHRQRRRGARLPVAARPRDAPHLRGAHPAHRAGLALHGAGRRLAHGLDRGAQRGAPGAGERRLPVHAPRLQRAVGAERVARGGAGGRGTFGPRAGAGAVDAA